jgi:hypothetical protein
MKCNGVMLSEQLQVILRDYFKRIKPPVSCFFPGQDHKSPVTSRTVHRNVLEADLVGFAQIGADGAAPRCLDARTEIRCDRKRIATRRSTAAIVSSKAAAFSGGGALQCRAHILVPNCAQSPIDRISAWRHGERGSATDESFGVCRRGPSKPSS